MSNTHLIWNDNESSVKFRDEGKDTCKNSTSPHIIMALYPLKWPQLFMVKFGTSKKSMKSTDIKQQTVTYRVSQEEWTKLRESVPYVELYRYNPKHLCPKLNGYGDNGQRSLKL